MLMFILFDVVIASKKKGGKLNDFMRIIAWFVGNEGIILVPLKILNLPEAYKSPTALAEAFFSYLIGFGVVGLGVGAYRIKKENKNKIVDDYLKLCLRNLLNYKEIDLLIFGLFKNGFDDGKKRDLEKMAKKSNVRVDQLAVKYMEILDKIYGVAERYIREIDSGESETPAQNI